MSKQYHDSARLHRDKMRILDRKLHHFVTDAVDGRFNRESKEHVDGTGRPWIQRQRITIDGIDGWALVDGFDFLGHAFVKLTPQEVVSAVLNRCGLFMTTASMHRSQFGPAYLTHHVQTFDTLDRLKFDTAWMFDLAVLLTFKENEIEREVMPYCRIDSELRQAGENETPALYCRIGTENDFRKIARYGIKLSDSEFHTIGHPSNFANEDLETIIRGACEQYVALAFEAGYHWGTAAEMETAVETMFDSPESESFAATEIGDETPSLFGEDLPSAAETVVIAEMPESVASA